MAMNHTDQDEDSVLISLSVVKPDTIDYTERRIRLTESHPTVQIGRSSTRAVANLLPAVTNGWFNSPVMSRHHAEITADISKKAVTIRDFNSMHGTYLNQDRVSFDKPQPLRAGDELILGLPVYRKDTNFDPVRAMVDGLEWSEASRSTTSPTRVFTVPDDCSTDDNEPLDEEPMPSPSRGPAVIDVEGGSRSAADTTLCSGTSIPQIDGVIDCDCPSDADSQASQMGDDEEVENSGCPGCAADHSEDDDGSLRLANDEMSFACGSPIESVSLSDTPHNASHDLDSPSPFWTRISSSSPDSDMDTDEDEDSDYGSEAGGLFLHDSESDNEDEMLSEARGFDTDPVGEGRAEEPAYPIHSSYSYGHTSATPRWLPPINTFVSPEWVHPPDVATMERQRLPSPSDAVLPHGHRRLETGPIDSNSSIASKTITKVAKAELMKIQPGLGRSTDEALGQHSGKVDFFEAREHNKMTIARLTQQSPQPTAPASLDGPTIPVHPLAVVPAMENHRPGVVADEPASVAFNSEDGPNKALQGLPELAKTQFFSHNPEVDAFGSDTVPLPLPLDTSQDLPKGASWFGFEPSEWEPTSAYELQQLRQRNYNLGHDWMLKQHVQENMAPLKQSAGRSGLPVADHGVTEQALVHRDLNSRSLPSVAESAPIEQIKNHNKPPAGRNGLPPTDDGVTEQGLKQSDLKALDLRVMEAATVNKVREKPGASSATETHNDTKGKRKADLISEATREEITWSRGNDGGPHNGTFDLGPPTSRLTGDRSPLPSPPTTPEERPTKRIKKIAERVGYAALGGATVGAMVLTSLIYSAPTFV